MPTPEQKKIQEIAKDTFGKDFVLGKAPFGCQPLGFYIKVEKKDYNKIIVAFNSPCTTITLFNNDSLLISYNENGFSEGVMRMVEDVIGVINILQN